MNILFSGWEIKKIPVSGANLRHSGFPLNQRLGTLFLDHWVLHVLQHSFSLEICCFYTGFGRVLNFCVIDPFACQLFLFCTFTRGTGDTRSILFGSDEFVFNSCNYRFVAIVLAFYTYSVGFLGEIMC